MPISFNDGSYFNDAHEAVSAGSLSLAPELDNTQLPQVVSKLGNDLLETAKIPGDTWQGKYTYDQITDKGIQLGMNVGMLSSPVPKPGLGTFGGMSGFFSKAAREEGTPFTNLGTAKDMLEKGNTPQEVWSKTGWYQDPRDSRWKFEINDDTAQFKGLSDRHKFGTDLVNVLDHPELYKAYPHLKDITIYHDPGMPENVLGEANINPKDPYIALRNPEASEENMRVLLHEIQHMIQSKEHFSLGSSVEKHLAKESPDITRAVDEATDKYKALLSKGFSNLSEEEKAELDKVRTTVVQGTVLRQANYMNAYNKYYNAGGEIESRNVADRYLDPFSKMLNPSITEKSDVNWSE